MRRMDLVLSVPVGTTIDLVEKYGVHAYPESYNYRHQDVNYITFRPAGGEMDAIYTIVRRFKSRPDAPDILKRASPEDHERLAGYIRDRYAAQFFDDEEYRFFILSQTERVKLP